MKPLAIISVGLLALFAACEKKAHGSDGTVPPGPSNTNPPPCSAPDTTPGAADAELSNRVRQAVTADTALAPTVTGLQVTAANGNVTLRGSVNTQKDKDAIGAKARGVQGVMGVTNDLAVSGG